MAAALPDLPLPAEISQCREELKAARFALEKAALAQVDPALHTLLCSIVGIGPLPATVLIAETWDIHRFASAKKLVAFAGLDPRVKQSGISLNRHGRLTKRGSSQLRRALFWGAVQAKRYDPELHAYYWKKRAEGKRHTEAVVAIAHKLTCRVYAVWKRGTPYEKRPAA